MPSRERPRQAHKPITRTTPSSTGRDGLTGDWYLPPRLVGSREAPLARGARQSLLGSLSVACGTPFTSRTHGGGQPVQSAAARHGCAPEWRNPAGTPNRRGAPSRNRKGSLPCVAASRCDVPAYRLPAAPDQPRQPCRTANPAAAHPLKNPLRAVLNCKPFIIKPSRSEARCDLPDASSWRWRKLPML
jgi:hypothetical protein